MQFIIHTDYSFLLSSQPAVHGIYYKTMLHSAVHTYITDPNTC
jgi:hypothetical protein